MTPPRTRLRRSVVSGAIIPLACVAGAVAGTFGVGVGASPAAAARIEVGVYQDNPVAGVPALTRVVGRRSTRVISTYVTGGKLVEPSVVALARRTHAAPAGELDARRRQGGRQAAPLQALASPPRRPEPRAGGPDQAAARPEARADPAPDAGAQHALVRLVGHGQRQHPGGLRGGLEAGAQGPCANAGGKRIRLLWAPYARSVPATPENAIAAYFPGAAQVDLVGTSGYNFGAQGGLAWTEPAALFEDAYREISALSPAPFWIAETGSTALGRQQGAVDRAARLAADRDPRTWPAWSGSTCATATATSASARRRRRASPSRISSSGGAHEPAPEGRRRGGAASRARWPAGPRPR